jgi:hypothetical protein
VRRAPWTSAALALALAAPGWAQPAAPDAREYIESVLANERVPLRFRDTPLADVVRGLQQDVWINIVLDRDVDRALRVTHQSDGARPLGPTLDALLGPLELGWTVWSDALVVHARGATLPAESTTPIASALAAYTVHHSVTAFNDALACLADLAQVRMELSAAARERAAATTVTLRVRNLPLHHLLTLLTRQVGLAWTPIDGVVWVHAPDEDAAAAQAEALRRQDEVRITLSLDARLDEIASAIASRAGIEVRLAEGVAADAPVALRVTEAGLGEVLDAVTGPLGLVWRRHGTAVVIGPKP